jgi:hypothetical protein
MANEQVTDRSQNRYGPVSFVAAMVNILVVEFVTWYFLPWVLIVCVILAILLVVQLWLFAVVVYESPGKPAQAARGMMIGWLSGPISLIIFVPVYLVM